MKETTNAIDTPIYTFFYKNVIFSTKASKEREIITYKITTMFLICHESKPLRSYTRGLIKKVDLIFFSIFVSIPLKIPLVRTASKESDKTAIENVFPLYPNSREITARMDPSFRWPRR